MRLLLALVFLLPGAARAFDLTVATYSAALSRAGPGLTLQHLLKADDPQVEQGLAVILRLDADVLLLTNIDYDYEGAALHALQDRLAKQGLSYSTVLALRPNTGLPTGLDLNHDGAIGGPRDAQAYGRFAGQGGMAVLSRYPIDIPQMRDFSALLWKDLPNADLPPDLAPDAALVQRLSTAGHYEIPVVYAPDKVLRLLVWAATPPVFDGPEDRNGRRNADETALWLDLLAGTLPDPAGGTYPPPQSPFVVMGLANLDPVDGDGKPQALRALMARPDLQDPGPRGTSGHLDPGHSGDPARDTMVLKSGAGLRLDYILPSQGITVEGSGVLWLPDTDPFAATLAAASAHRPVWARLTLP